MRLRSRARADGVGRPAASTEKRQELPVITAMRRVGTSEKIYGLAASAVFEIEQPAEPSHLRHSLEEGATSGTVCCRLAFAGSRQNLTRQDLPKFLTFSAAPFCLQGGGQIGYGPEPVRCGYRRP